MKIGNKDVCPNCGSSNTTALGPDYIQGSNGFGDKTLVIIYHCNECHSNFHN